MTNTRIAPLIGYDRVARSVGLDPNRMLRRAGIDPRWVAEPDRRIEIAALAGLLEDSAAESGVEHFGLLLAGERSLSHMGPLSLLLIHQPTLRDVLSVFIEFQRLITDGSLIALEEQGETTLLHARIGTTDPHRQLSEWLMLAVTRDVAQIAGADWRPESAHFSHAAPADRGLYEQVFLCPLVFESGFTGYRCSTAQFGTANVHADPALAAHARTYLETLRDAVDSASIAERGRRALHLLLPAGRGSLDEIARTLHLAPRTIQRQLEREGLTFAELLNSVRRELVMRYLEGNTQMSTIASLLGYTTPSSFTRWFQDEYDCSPSQWRVRQTAQPGESPRVVHGTGYA